MDCWQKLGIEETVDKREIKRAYAKLIKQYHPESDPEEFQAVREAYEQALWFADYSLQNTDESDGPPNISEVRREPADQTPAEQTASALREKDKVRDAQVENIDAALAKLVPLLQRDDAIAIAFCRTTLKESFFAALDVRYEFEGKLLITLLQNDLLPFSFLKYLVKEFEWDINMNRPGRMVIGHFDNDVRYSGAFYAVARRYLAEMVRRALRVHIQGTHSWIAADRFDRLDTILFTENPDSKLAEFCKNKQDREMVESGMAFLLKNQYVTNHSSFVPWKTVQWLFENNIARPVDQPKAQPIAQPQKEESSGFPGWAIWLAVVIGIRLIAAIANDSPSTRPVSTFTQSSSSDTDTAPRDEMRRMMQLRHDAESGKKEAQYNLGLEYLNGTVLPKDQEKALQWLRRSADQNYPQAQETLGMLYYTGEAGAQDYILAMEMLKGATNYDRPNAVFWLGKAYEEGKAVERDEPKARELLDRAIELGSTEAMRTKGSRLIHGQFEKKDIAKGTELLTNAAEKGDVNAAYQLAQEYLSGEPLKLSYEDAYKWLDVLSTREIPIAQLWLSQLYEKGLGVSVDSSHSQRLIAMTKERVSPNTIKDFAWGLAVHPNKQMRNGTLAIELMEHLLTEPINFSAAGIDTLAAAYAESGHFEKAVETEQQALKALTTDTTATADTRHEYERRLKRYQNNRTAFR